MFPTFTDDQLLYSFQTRLEEKFYKNNMTEDDLIEKMVIPEEMEDIENIKANSILKDLVTPVADGVMDQL